MRRAGLSISICILFLASCSSARHGGKGKSRDRDDAGSTSRDGGEPGPPHDTDAGREELPRDAGNEDATVATTSECGDDVAEGSEPCDGDDLRDQSCEDLGYVGGELGCSSSCRWDTSECESEAANVPPRILTISSNVTTMKPTNTLIISAVVTDPNGIEDLIGGTLEHPSGGTYGSFSTTADEGTYQITLTWNAIHTVSPIQFASGGGTRSFRARFFDVQGEETFSDLTIRLECTDSNDGACAGSCVDLQTSNSHCGSCNNPVPTRRRCEAGTFACYEGYEMCGGDCMDSSGLETCDGQCVYPETDEMNCGACGNVCPSGSGCDEGVCSYYVSATTRSRSCDDLCGDLGGSCTSVVLYYTYRSGCTCTGIGCGTETVTCAQYSRTPSCAQTVTRMNCYCEY